MVFSKGVRAPVCAHGTQYFLIIYKEKSAPAMTHQWHWADQYVMLIHPTRLLGRGRWFGDRWQVRNAASAKWGHLPCLGNGNEQSGRCWRRFGECQVSIAQKCRQLVWCTAQWVSVIYQTYAMRQQRNLWRWGCCCRHPQAGQMRSYVSPDQSRSAQSVSKEAKKQSQMHIQ